MAYTAGPWLTSFQAHGTKLLLYLFAPYGTRLTTLWVTSNDGSSSNSTSATSGAPDPAFSASAIFTYSGLPAPTSSCVTQIDGWVLLNSLTARPIPGTQAQNVTFVAEEFLQEPPATSVALELALALALEEPAAAGLVLLPPHAASRESAAAPARPVAVRPAMRRAPGERGQLDREVEGIFAELLRVSCDLFSGVPGRPQGPAGRLATGRRRLDHGERLRWQGEGERRAFRGL